VKGGSALSTEVAVSVGRHCLTPTSGEDASILLQGLSREDHPGERTHDKQRSQGKCGAPVD
jgi:hypothetical protein